MYRNLLLTIEYDGSDFAGWQIQPSARTVQGEITKAFLKMTGREVRVEGTSRTDAGVHALGQRATVRGDFGIPLERIPLVLNRLLPDDIKIIRAEDKEGDFHARFTSEGKEYIYRIKNTAEKSVFERNYFCFAEKPLDAEAMDRAAKAFEGTHDFKAFMAMGSTPQKSTVRTIFSAAVTREGDLIEFRVSGNGFLYNMVRIMAGTLMDVGSGRLDEEGLGEIIERGERSEAGRTAPPQGLYLNRVFYPGDGR